MRSLVFKTWRVLHLKTKDLSFILYVLCWVLIYHVTFFYGLDDTMKKVKLMVILLKVEKWDKSCSEEPYIRLKTLVNASMVDVP